VLGILGLVAFARIPSHRLGRVGMVLYGACLLGLIAAIIPGLGHRANGAARWLAFGSLRLQPSEFMKLALLLVVADRVNRHPGGLTDPRHAALPILGLTLPVLALVVLQPDFGTTVILAGTVGFVLFLGGVSLRWTCVLGALTVAAAVPFVLLDSYRLARVSSWLDPWENFSKGGYQVIMGWVALHHGGLWGQGLGQAMSSQKWLPFAHTDFIAAVTGEELGFAVVALLLGAYGVLIWRGARIAVRSRSYFGTLVAGAVTIVLGAQTLFNLGVILGFVPPKGLVLPFMSYGASALVAHLWSVGVLLSISTELEAPALAHAAGGGGRGRLIPVQIGAGMARWGRLARATALRRSAS
jgi:cell division protein FtsW